MPGGRAGLTRVASVISDVFVSYQVDVLLPFRLLRKLNECLLQVPEYTAYDQMLSSFK